MSETTPHNPAAAAFLQSRRSRPYKTLEAPVPSRDILQEILTAGARVPDHGKLEPFRFMVLEAPAMERLAVSCVAHGNQQNRDPDAIEKMRFQLASAPLAVAVIACQKPSEKIPTVEQMQSAACACFSILNAALALGWGANWLTGWAAHDRAFLTDAMGLEETESLVGWVHIGTARATPPERPRPDISAITQWVDQ